MRDIYKYIVHCDVMKLKVLCLEILQENNLRRNRKEKFKVNCGYVMKEIIKITNIEKIKLLGIYRNEKKWNMFTWEIV